MVGHRGLIRYLYYGRASIPRSARHTFAQVMLLLRCQIIVDRALSQGTLTRARLNGGCVA